jgi:hypothetical protein
MFTGLFFHYSPQLQQYRPLAAIFVFAALPMFGQESRNN